MFVLHLSRQEMDKFASTWIKWQKWLLFAALSLNCELKMAVFRGKVLAAQFVNAFTRQFIRDTPAVDTGGQKQGNILTTAKYLRISENIRQKTQHCHLVIYLGVWDTTAVDTGSQKHGNILTTAKYLRISKNIYQYQATNNTCHLAIHLAVETSGQKKGNFWLCDNSKITKKYFWNIRQQ